MLFVSHVVFDECLAGDPIAAADRIQLIRGIPSLEVTDEVNRLAKSLLEAHAIPTTEPRDAGILSVSHWENPNPTR